jgi:DNA helicase-2/ATP-dependent DNA helicase PcrA
MTALDAALAALDPEQAHVAAWRPGSNPKLPNLRIIAPAGSGKTRVLTVLSARLIAEAQVNPQDLVLLTFANKAAKVCQERIADLLPPHLVPQRVGTFHSIALRRLRDAEASGLVDQTAHRWSQARCLDSDGKTRSTYIPSAYVLWRCATEYGRMPGTKAESLRIAKSYDEVSRYERFAGICRSAGVENDAELAQNDSLSQRAPTDFGEAWALVREAKLALNAWDFDDAIAAYLLELSTHGSVFDRAALVLCDETQDNNDVQMQILEKLAGSQGAIVVVGDGAQAVHVWRGANPELFQQADIRLKAETRHLARNYRSVPEIVDLGNAITKGRKWKLGPPSIATRETAKTTAGTASGTASTQVIPPIRAIVLGEAPMEVAQRIELAVKKGTATYADFAVLTRTNAHLTNFQAALAAYNIPAKLVGTDSVFDHREVETFLAWCVLAQHDAYTSLEKAARFPNRYLAASFAKAVRDHRGLGFVKAIEAAIGALPPARRKGAEALLKDIQWMRSLPWSKVPDFVLDLLLASTNEKNKQKAGDSPDEDRPGLYRAAHRIVSRFEDAERAVDFAERCAALAFMENADQDAVVLSTVHRFKGREAPHVYLYCPAGSFPSAKSGKHELEDERRLFYVAVTRAADTLTLVSEGPPCEFAIHYCGRVFREVGVEV